jgi:molecular chaperone DnaK
VLLLDVTPLSLGVETLGGVMTTLIERNTTIPVKRSEIFSTAEDNQTAVDVHVMQGERSLAADNMSLGRFRLEGIPPAARGVPQVEVTFDIDANGILNVGARDKASGREQKVTITASTNLNKAEIDRMVDEARKNESEDRKRRELIEARNAADTLVYQTEKTLAELGARVPDEERQKIQEQVNTLREAIKGDDAAAIKRTQEHLQNAFHALSQQLDAQSAAGTQPGGNDHSGGSPEGDVLEGEYREA